MLAVDVLNAFDTPSLNPSLSSDPLSLLVNLGDLPGAPRDIMVVNPATFKQTCINFPVGIGAPAAVVTCPMLAYTLWVDEAYALNVSRNAIARAAAHGRAASGADEVKAAGDGYPRLKSRPTFSSGEGGTVTFVATLKTSSGAARGDICVSMPGQRYGIPRIVPCDR
jgi:hypothetical protein